MSTQRMPAIFVPHGGGPWPWIPDQVPMYAALDAYLRGLAASLPRKPAAILVVSAHWEQPVPTLMSSPKPTMLYDYSGFPDHTYRVVWPAPGAPILANEIAEALTRGGMPARCDPDRGFDHGTFVPLALGFPDADIPTLQLSLIGGLDPAAHIRLGQLLAPWRERDVLIVGSGMSYHNMRGFGQSMRGEKGPIQDARAFDAWLAGTMTREADERNAQLIAWSKVPQARSCHPREEHLMPLHVIAGCGGDDAATLPFRDHILGVPVSAVQFG